MKTSLIYDYILKIAVRRHAYGPKIDVIAHKAKCYMDEVHKWNVCLYLFVCIKQAFTRWRGKEICLSNFGELQRRNNFREWLNNLNWKAKT